MRPPSCMKHRRPLEQAGCWLLYAIRGVLRWGAAAPGCGRRARLARISHQAPSQRVGSEKCGPGEAGRLNDPDPGRCLGRGQDRAFSAAGHSSLKWRHFLGNREIVAVCMQEVRENPRRISRTLFHGGRRFFRNPFEYQRGIWYPESRVLTRWGSGFFFRALSCVASSWPCACADEATDSGACPSCQSSGNESFEASPPRPTPG